MSDRELLELGAKAAGFYVCSDLEYLGLKEWGEELWVKEEKYGEYRSWNPLVDDGDALRLAVQLTIHLKLCTRIIIAEWSNTDEDIVESRATDPCASTRRAIVRAAAARGAKLPC